MIKFSLPDYYNHNEIIIFFLELQKICPECFIDNRQIDSAYGYPDFLNWNGGRVIESFISPSDCYEIANNYHTNFPNFHLRHTCTNLYITPNIYNDFQNNLYLKNVLKKNDSIIVNNDHFGEYLKEKYPEYDIIYSTTKNIRSVEDYNKYSKNNLTVLNYIHNHDEKLISKLKYPQNIEILCAEECVDNCSCRQEHYEIISKQIMLMPDAGSFKCPHMDDHNLNFYTDILQRKHAITNEYIDYLYEKYGINNFKISGRKNNNITYVEAIIYYLIKPEYRDSIRNTALMRIYNII